MVTQISNGQLSIRVNHKGAELASLFNHATGLDYLWNADPRFWAKHSPVLFPVVGTLKDGSFIYEGKSYPLSRHGFARDMDFQLESREPGKVVFLLRSTDDTRQKYPFEFALRIVYQLDGFSIRVGYEVRNLSGKELLFSLGAHPAFRVPLVPGTEYSDYFLRFNQKESSNHWPISEEGYIGENSKPFFIDDNILPLRHELFYGDAIVFKDLKSSSISLRSHKHTHGLDLSFPGFPYFGIWAARDAGFVCLEPWCGIADSVGHDRQLRSKEGIVSLPPGEEWQRAWTATTY